jgi:hypothetical protein
MQNVASGPSLALQASIEGLHRFTTSNRHRLNVRFLL